jgi:hypothetical protein
MCDAKVISFMLCNVCMKRKPNNLKNKKIPLHIQNFWQCAKNNQNKIFTKHTDTSETWSSFTMTFYSLLHMRFCNLLTTMQDKADTCTRFVKSRGPIIVVQVCDCRTGYSFFIYYSSVEVDVMTCPRILITA